VIRLFYGAADTPEEFVLASPGVQTVLFCWASDRDRTKIDGGLPSGGEAGAAGDENLSVEALLCDAWSYGAAELEIETAAFPMQERVSLEKEQGVCTVKSEVKLERPDAGS
jgi:hypothetical protein